MRICILFLMWLFFGCKENLTQEKSINLGNEIKTERRKNISEPESAVTLSKAEFQFDKVRWMAKDDHHYIYRNEMLAELMKNHTLDSMNKDEILDLLGEPEQIDNNHLFYIIAQKRLGFWPLHTKTLVIKFDKDTVDWIRIHE